MTIQQKIGLPNLLILGGLLYTLLALAYHAIIAGEPSIKFAFNIFTGLAGIAIGLISKFVVCRREGRVINTTSTAEPPLN